MRLGPLISVCAAVVCSSTAFAQASGRPLKAGLVMALERGMIECAASEVRHTRDTTSQSSEGSLSSAPADSQTSGFQKGGIPQGVTSTDAPQAESLSSDQSKELLNSGEPPRLGHADAPVTFVVFGDFECSFCKRLNEIIEGQLAPRHKEDITVVYRYFPLPQHPWARVAAQMSECVKSQNQKEFWKLGDYLYSNQDTLSISSIRSQVNNFLAREGQVDQSAFAACVDQESTANLVNRDIQIGLGLGVHSTPAIFVNGTKLHGVQSLQQLEVALKTALEATTSAGKSKKKEQL